MKILFPILVVGCLSACSIEQFTMEKDPFSESIPKQVENLDMESEADYAKRNHGIVNIHRHGPGYDVMMMLNAGESDIIFSMDLPPGGDTQFVAPGQSNSGSSDSKRSLASASTTEQEGEKEFFNQEALAMFSDATKHMLSAQALFYRKSYWKALEETNKAMALVPSSAQAYALKGSIYYKMGRKKDARVSWQKALALDPSLNDVKESLKLVN